MKDYNLIASGSSGNCIIYKKHIMVDIGIKKKDKDLIEPYLDDIKVIIITHRHSDHLQLPLMKWLISEYSHITYMYLPDVKNFLDEKLGSKSKGEFIPIKVPKFAMIQPKKIYNLGIVRVQFMELYHDVPNVGMYFTWKDGFTHFHGIDTHTLEGIKIPKNTKLVAIEHHHEEEHYRELISEKEENGTYSHEMQAQNVHMSFEDAEKFLERNELYGATVLRLHLSSDDYYKDIPIEYIYEGDKNETDTEV